MEGREITPYRMQILMDVAARVVKVMVTGAWHLSFEEMEVILTMVRSGVEECKERDQRGEMDYVPENRGA